MAKVEIAEAAVEAAVGVEANQGGIAEAEARVLLAATDQGLAVGRGEHIGGLGVTVDAAGGVVEVQGGTAEEARIVRARHGVDHADADRRI